MALAVVSIASAANGDANNVSLAGATAAVPIPGGGFYIADAGNHQVHRVNGAGQLTTIAGTGVAGQDGDGGQATAAKLSYPTDAVPDPDGNVLIASTGLYGGGGGRVRKVTNSTGVISTVAGGAVADNPSTPEDDGTICAGATNDFGDGCPATQAVLGWPTAAVPQDGGGFLIADYLQGRVRKVSGSNIITTVAGGASSNCAASPTTGDGCLATEVSLGSPSAAIPFDINGAAVDTTGTGFLIATGCKIRYVNAAGIISTVAGTGNCRQSGDPAQPATGSATALKLSNALDARPSATAGVFLLADGHSCAVRRVDMTNPSSPTYTTLTSEADCGGNGASYGVTAAIPAPDGAVLIADAGDSQISQSDSSGNTTVVAGNGQPSRNTALPSISGTPSVGSTLSCSNGTWNPPANGYTRTWNSNGTAISGATNPMYVVRPADAGRDITCTVTASYTSPPESFSATSPAVRISGPGGNPPGGNPGGGSPGGGGAPGGGTGNAVSNVFKFAGASASSKNGQVTVTLNVPGPGKVRGVATAKVQVSKKKKVTVASASVTARKAGKVKLKLKPKGKAKKQLKSKGKLKASLKITYTPTGGAPKSSTRSVSFKLKKPKKKR